MRPTIIRAVVLVAACLFSCTDLGDPYVFRADCDRSTGGIDFGTVPLGHFADRTLLIANSGNDDLVGSVDLADPNFVVMSGEGPFAVAPGESREVLLRYAPKDTGNHQSEVQLGNGCPAVRIVGIGAPPPEGPQCVVDPAVLAFGAVKTGDTAQRTFEIRNVGLIDFNVDVAFGGTGPFELVAGGGFASLDPGDTVRVTVRFAPTTTGDFAEDLAIGSTCDVLPVTGTGNPPFTVSFQNDVQPIFNTYCVVCHTLRGSGSLDLRALNSYTQLVNVVTVGYPPALRVKPGDPTASVMYGKISDSGQYGGAMPPPPAPSVPLAGRLKIETWIREGAVRN